MKVVLLLAFCAVAAYAQRPCAVPFQITFGASQWEVDDKRFAAYTGVYDRQNLRTGYYEEVDVSSVRDFYHYIFLHSESRGFQYNIRRKTCKSFRIGEFRPWEVPRDAKYIGEFEIGGPGELVSVDQWSDQTATKRETWMGDFSLKNCFPVNQFLLNAQDFNKTIISHYYNVISGIINPKIFDVPAECKRATMEESLPWEARMVQAIHTGTLDN